MFLTAVSHCLALQVLQIKKEEEEKKKRDEEEERARMLKEQERERKDRDREMRLRARQDEEVLSAFPCADLHTCIVAPPTIRAVLEFALLPLLNVL